jgi:hypothetical protein
MSILITPVIRHLYSLSTRVLVPFGTVRAQKVRSPAHYALLVTHDTCRLLLLLDGC